MAGHAVRIRSDGKNFGMSQQFVAALLGVDADTLTVWDRQPNPPPRSPDGRYDTADLLGWILEFLPDKPGAGHKYPWRIATTANPVLDEQGKPVLSMNKADVAIRLQLAQAIKVEMENETTAGNLIPLPEIETSWQMIMSAIKTRMLKIPQAISPLLVGETDTFVIQEKLKQAVYDALTEASVTQIEIDDELDD